MRVTGAIALIIVASTTIARGQSLQEQAICAKQAEKAFQDYISHDGSSPGLPGFKYLNRDYQSHYNPKLNKCLILINEIFDLDGRAGSSTKLVDAFERRTFALYFFSGINNADCELTPALNQTTTFCSSRAEFDEFVSK